MPSERGRNHMNLPWILKLGYLFYLLTLAYAAPTSDLAPALSPRPDTETDLLYALDQDEGNPLVKRRLNRYATGWPIGRDLHRNKIYAFGPSINSLPRGIVTVGGRINGGSTGEIHLASLLTFNQPREVRQNTESRKWGGKPVGDEQAQNNLVAKLSELSQTYRAARITESLEARNIVPRVYTALKVPPNCDNGVPYWSLVVMERMDEDAAHALRDYSKGRASRGFNRLSLMKQFVGGLDYAHDLGIAHDDPHLNNLMRHAGSNRWKIIDWDFATDYGRKPGKVRITSYTRT
ncbi:hypothetical protein NUU61_009790 [Penicillium alfredii]|uniref:Protein kinase domain-containing protein n=1 Tax=Penicillium alfredii TaxID=1506179 RepID=A0A9W9JU11_9EURO|nr:uncharacterized protein NUU61_009790 [Penicillium alfredii]KAJ5081526.1 hypothetical protein NUU61_009790 [Penicillium alfredii]